MFEPKVKEPELSEHMQNILNRSIDEQSVHNTDEIIRYKYKIMKLFLSNRDLLSTLHNEMLEERDGLINGELYRGVNIFDYLRIPDLKDEVKNYVCFEVFEEGYHEITERQVLIRCITFRDDCRTDWDVARQDLLAAIIKTEFDWTNMFGMTLIRTSDEGGMTNDGYYYREMVYRSAAPNNLYNKVNNYPGKNYLGK